MFCYSSWRIFQYDWWPHDCWRNWWILRYLDLSKNLFLLSQLVVNYIIHNMTFAMIPDNEASGFPQWATMIMLPTTPCCWFNPNMTTHFDDNNITQPLIRSMSHTTTHPSSYLSMPHSPSLQAHYYNSRWSARRWRRHNSHCESSDMGER